MGESLKPLLPLNEAKKKVKNAIFCRYTISLSQKELLRWQRAGRAFAQELSRDKVAGSTNYNSNGETSDPNRTTASPALTLHEHDLQDHPQKNGDPHVYNDLKRLHCLAQTSTSVKVGGADIVHGMDSTYFVTRSANIDMSPIPGLIGVDGRKGYAGIFGTSALFVISGAYAGIHLALWNYIFPTRIEGLLWKIACCTLCVPIVICLGGMQLVSVVAQAVRLCFNRLYPECRRLVRRFTSQKGQHVGTEESLKTGGPDRLTGMKFVLKKTRAISPPFGKFVILCLDKLALCVVIVFIFIPLFCLMVAICLAFLCGIPLYVFARFYIIVEAVISLRRVPVGVYEQVSWSQYIPHL